MRFLQEMSIFVENM